MTTQTPNPLAVQARALRATLKEKAEARDSAVSERARLSAELPRLRAAHADSAYLMKKAKVGQLLARGAPTADAELADARKKHDATADLVDDVEERLALLSEVHGDLERDVVKAREDLKTVEEALLREVLRRRAEESTPLLRALVREIALSLSIEGHSVGDSGIVHEIRKRLGGDHLLVGSDTQELRGQLLVAEGAL
jgi:hypothetical protein